MPQEVFGCLCVDLERVFVVGYDYCVAETGALPLLSALDTLVSVSFSRGVVGADEASYWSCDCSAALFVVVVCCWQVFIGVLDVSGAGEVLCGR